MDATKAAEVLERDFESEVGVSFPADGEYAQAQKMAIAALKAQGRAEPALVVEREPDHWQRGHFYEGRDPWINPSKVYKLKIGDKLYLAPQPESQPAPDVVGDLQFLLRRVVRSACKHGDCASICQAAMEYLEQIGGNDSPLRDLQPAQWEIERNPIAVQGYDEATQIRLKIGNQSFNINDYCENHEQADFMARMLDHALRKIAQPAQAVLDGWHPIETAPKDGTRLLLLREADSTQFTGAWCDCYGWSDFNAPIAGVTHWMPLPAAPAPGGEGS